MKIGIIGTRGIPNQYGGFEQFADILSQGLTKKGNDITVYCSANHSYTKDEYKGVHLIHKYDPENKIGTIGQFIYDLGCILDARKKKFDIIYLLGYGSSSIWQRILYKKKAIVITNMDGLEWKRSKYSYPVQKFFKYAEKLAVKYSDYLVADSIGIQEYFSKKYSVKSEYYPYGSFIFTKQDDTCLTKYNLKKYNYDMLIARFEPENNIDMVLEAFSKSSVNRKFILIGDYKRTKFGNELYVKYEKDSRIHFIGGLYNQGDLDNLRYFSNLYFHGHSVGGTNPSLLEAMGSSALICYHDNVFNKYIVGNDGLPFSNSETLKNIIETTDKSKYQKFVSNNLDKISKIYNWDIITDQYEKFFSRIIKK
ncbi:MAG: DUF1972 domain-containing protein [Clostridia bacterium]